MRLLLLIRETNWLAVLSLLLLIAAPIVTYFTAPEFTGITIGLSAIAFATLAKND